MKTGDWPPAKSGESIYEFVVSNTDSGGEFDISAGDLPDEDRAQPQEIRYAPGAKDSLFGSGKPSTDISERASRIAKLMASASKRPSKRVLRALYEALEHDDSIDLADPLLKELGRLEVNNETLHHVGRWLATTGVDRGPVKIGIVVLGTTGLAEDLDVVQALGRYEEFTLYSAVAIENGVVESELLLLNLAQSVQGWGRIQSVRRLDNAKNPAVREWILREGFRNSIMFEELAHFAATVGGLNAALRSGHVDRNLHTAAGQIFIALAPGGPFKGLTDYVDGADAVEAYLQLSISSAESLIDFLALSAIRRFLQAESDWDALSQHGWTATRREVFERECESILGRPEWENTVRAELLSDDAREFALADQVAHILAIDTYALFLKKIIGDPLGQGWYRAWKQADDHGRAIELAALARELLPLDAISTGPGTSMGLGKEWKPHRALDWTLQALRDHVGVGADLVLVGLQSPVTRNRNMSLKVLESWPHDAWPEGALDLLAESTATEPNQKTRELAQEILSAAEG